MDNSLPNQSKPLWQTILLSVMLFFLPSMSIVISNLVIVLLVELPFHFPDFFVWVGISLYVLMVITINIFVFKFLKTKLNRVLYIYHSGWLFLLIIIAIPNLLVYNVRSRKSETEVVLTQIMKAQMAHRADANVFISTRPCPDLATFDKKQSVDWYANAPNAFGTGFELIGEVADQYVYCSYVCKADDVIGGAGDAAICAATCDIDGDGEKAVYAVALSNNGSNLGGLDITTLETGDGPITACRQDENGCIYDDRDDLPKCETVVRCTDSEIH